MLLEELGLLLDLTFGHKFHMTYRDVPTYQQRVPQQGFNDVREWLR
jgi:hypothetical protein